MVLVQNKLRRKIYLFNRKPSENSVVTTHYNKFINRLHRKGLKSRYLTFFYNLLREHKKKVKNLCKWKYGSDDLTKVPVKVKIPTFPRVIRGVFSMISLKLELRYRKFRKKEILVPVPIAPWRGLRLGLTLLLKNSRSRVQHIKVHRKVEFLNKLLTEIWETYYRISLTAKDVIEFTDKVLNNTENFRSTQLFPVKLERRNVLPAELESTKTTTDKELTNKKILEDGKKYKVRKAFRVRKKLAIKRLKRWRYKTFHAKDNHFPRKSFNVKSEHVKKKYIKKKFKK